MKKYINIFKEKIRKDPKIIIIIGLIGIFLIFFSSFFESDDNEVKAEKISEISASEYSQSLEKRLSEQISEVVGGDVKVMVTLETGIEYVYASEAKNNVREELEDAQSDKKQKSQKDEESENNYIIYKDENGNEVPLVVTEIMPNIKGVVVGCENGDNETVAATVKNLVKTALNISDDKVCVVGLNIG